MVGVLTESGGHRRLSAHMSVNHDPPDMFLFETLGRPGELRSIAGRRALLRRLLRGPLGRPDELRSISGRRALLRRVLGGPLGRPDELRSIAGRRASCLFFPCLRKLPT